MQNYTDCKYTMGIRLLCADMVSELVNMLNSDIESERALNLVCQWCDFTGNSLVVEGGLYKIIKEGSSIESMS